MGGYGTLLCLLALLTGAPVAADAPLDALAAAAIETEKLGAIVPSDVVLEDATGRKVAIGDFHLVDAIWVFLYPVLYLV